MELNEGINSNVIAFVHLLYLMSTLKNGNPNWKAIFCSQLTKANQHLKTYNNAKRKEVSKHACKNPTKIGMESQ